VQARVFDLGAAVHHHLKAGGLGARRRRVVAYADLHPQHLGADGDGVIGERSGGLGIAEDVDHVDALGNVLQVTVDGLAENRLANRARVDRDDTEPLALQILHGEIAGPVPVRGGADHGDDARAIQDRSQVLVAIAVVIH